MITIPIPINVLEYNLLNERVTTPVSVRLEEDAVMVEFVAAGDPVSFTFELAGDEVRVVRRGYKDGSPYLATETLHDFRRDAMEKP